MRKKTTHCGAKTIVWAYTVPRPKFHNDFYQFSHDIIKVFRKIIVNTKASDRIISSSGPICMATIAGISKCHKSQRSCICCIC